MSKIIESIEYFPAGYCTSQLGLLFKHVTNRKMLFPAGVFLLKHRDKGYILYDTGYSYAIKGRQAKYALYRMGTPVVMEASDQIDRLLAQKGVGVEDISYVILSHLHPDHIGGAGLFPNAHFIVTQSVYGTYQKPTLQDLVFKDFLPSDFEERLTVVKPSRVYPRFPYEQTFDLFADGSIYLSSIGGHASGQACLYLQEHQLFLAADLCWGIDLLPYTEDMRLLPSKVQADKKSYLAGVNLLRQIQSDGIKVLVSHDPVERVVKILHE